jgi:8-oxo-dGTP diphosphatase
LAQREFPELPIVGVGAVVIEGNRVVLIRRGQEPLKGEWSIPGGALELGETLEEGVCREVAEETGLTVEVVEIVEVLEKIVFDENSLHVNGGEAIENSHRRVRFHYVLIDFLCKAVSGVLAEASDADDAGWIEHDELNSHDIYRLAPATIAVIEKAFTIHAVNNESD